MNKKFFISLGITLSIIFSFTFCFATDNGPGSALGNTANNVRNVVGGVENTVENAARDVSNTSKDATGSVENKMHNDTNAKNDNHAATGKTTTSNTDGRYNARRTSTGTTLMGMTNTGWTWLILGIAAIAIIAVVWYYSMQFTNNNNNNDDRLD